MGTELQNTVTRLGEHLLQHGTDGAFRDAARVKAQRISVQHLSGLRALFHKPPPEPGLYDHREHGLGGWLSACQFAIFELVYNLGEDALPFLREVAWGDYDWTQGNAIELLIRLAAAGVRTDEIVEEVETKYPQVRFEAQLYAIEPLISRLQDDPALQAVFDRLMEVEAFREAYEEVTWVDDDPYNIKNEKVHGDVISARREDEWVFKDRVIGSLVLHDFTVVLDARDGAVRVCLTETCKLFRLASRSTGNDAAGAPEVEPTDLEEMLAAKRIAVGHWDSAQTDESPVHIYPRSVIRLR